jgi:hypothetical protein
MMKDRRLTRSITLFAVLTMALALDLRGDAAAQAGAKAARKTPPLELPAFQLPRPNDVVRQTYQFAADHPEVLMYMPCFCGCSRSGHTSNADCFVKSRAKNGDVTEWQEHGAVCAMCLAVGETAMRMYAAGAPVKDIRAEIERKYASPAANEYRTQTPAVPAR